jgi:hypothetical protein
MTKSTKIELCKNCYGKGYFTEFKGNTLTQPDFTGDKPRIFRGSGIRIKLCDCQRGRDLKMFFTIKRKFQY